MVSQSRRVYGFGLTTFTTWRVKDFDVFFIPSGNLLQFAIENGTNNFRGFTELKDGDFPVRKLQTFTREYGFVDDHWSVPPLSQPTQHSSRRWCRNLRVPFGPTAAKKRGRELPNLPGNAWKPQFFFSLCLLYVFPLKSIQSVLVQKTGFWWILHVPPITWNHTPMAQVLAGLKRKMRFSIIKFGGRQSHYILEYVVVRPKLCSTPTNLQL